MEQNLFKHINPLYAGLSAICFVSKSRFRNSHPELFLRKSDVKISGTFTGEHTCQCHAMPTLLKLHFGMGVLLEICCIIPEHLFLGTPLGGCFCRFINQQVVNWPTSNDANEVSEIKNKQQTLSITFDDKTRIYV